MFYAVLCNLSDEKPSPERERAGVRLALYKYYGGFEFPPPHQKSHFPIPSPQTSLSGPTEDWLGCNAMKTVEIDPKGRVVIPKDVREQSGIATPGELLVTVEGAGKISLQSAQTSLKKAQQIGRRKLKSWTENRHDEDKLALQMAREERD